MNFPFALPDWMPWWAPTIVLVLALLWLLAFLIVPFSVIGVKSRLDGLEARLDEIQAEIRTLTLRLPDAGHAVEFNDLYAAPPFAEPEPSPPRRPHPFSRPPIPPAAHQLDEPEHPLAAPAPPPGGVGRGNRPEGPRARREGRSEPRLDWPR